MSKDYKKGTAYRVSSKNSKYHDEIGLVMYSTDKTVVLKSIRPRTKDEHNKALKECNGCVGFGTNYPIMTVHKSSIQKLKPSDISNLKTQIKHAINNQSKRRSLLKHPQHPKN